MRRRSALAAALLLAASLLLAVPPAQAAGNGSAAGETDPVGHSGDAADDPAIWVDPSDPGRSVVIGTDKQGALEVYDLSGSRIQRLSGGGPNNVDLRSGFPLAGAPAVIVGVSDASAGTLRFFRLSPATRQLTEIGARTIRTGIGASGVCLYRSPGTGRLYAFHTGANGQVAQWEISDAGGGLVDAGLVRGPWDMGTNGEGCVADDVTGALYLAEQNVGIWRYGAEPGDPTGAGARSQVDTAGAGGHLTADVEGLTIAATGGGDGLLLASSQGSSTFVAYRRDAGNAYVRSFSVGAGAADGCSKTDGIAAVVTPLNATYPQGLFVCQDNTNTSPAANQNFKLVPIEQVVDLGTTPPPSGTPAFRSASSSGSPKSRSTVRVPRPEGVAAGDLLLASVTVNNTTAVVAPPAGWQLVRRDLGGTVLAQSLYRRVAGAAEPSSYTFTLSAGRRVTVGIFAYSGVDPAAPVEASAGAGGTTSPSVTTAEAGAMLVVSVSAAIEGTVAPATGLTERWEAASPQTTSARDVVAESADRLLAAAGPSGEKTATLSSSGAAVAAAVALRPAG